MTQTSSSSSAFLERSGPIVVFNHGLTATCGLGGSDLICLLAFLKLCPTVLTPTWKPASRKLTPLRIPSPVGLALSKSVAAFDLPDGNKSSGVNEFCG